MSLRIYFKKTKNNITEVLNYIYKYQYLKDEMSLSELARVLDVKNRNSTFAQTGKYS